MTLPQVACRTLQKPWQIDHIGYGTNVCRLRTTDTLKFPFSAKIIFGRFVSLPVISRVRIICAQLHRLCIIKCIDCVRGSVTLSIISLELVLAW